MQCSVRRSRLQFLFVLFPLTLIPASLSAQQLSPEFLRGLQWRLIGPHRGGRDFSRLRFNTGLPRGILILENQSIMRVTVSHNRPVEEVKSNVDRSFEDMFKAVAGMPLQLAQEEKTWKGNRLNFSLLAKMGFMSTPIKGFIDVTDRDVTIDVDLGIFERLIPAEKVRGVLGDRVRGLLN